MDTYHGIVLTYKDAITLFEACRLGLLPRVQRRLSEKERHSIKSGSVFVWDEREAGMRRWTDGKSWSASRISGICLIYQEMEGKRGGRQFVPPPVSTMAGKTPDSGKRSDDDQDMKGDGPDGYRNKPDGLMKQSFSITTSTGQHLHLISYFSRPHSNASELMQPTNHPQFRGIVPVKGLYPDLTAHEAQELARASMQQSPYIQQLHSHMHPSQRMPYAYHVPQGEHASPPFPVSTPPYQRHPHIFSSHLPPPSGSMHVAPHLMKGNPQQVHTPYKTNPSPRLEQAPTVAKQQAQMVLQALQNILIDSRITEQVPRAPLVAPVNVNGIQTNGAPKTTTPPQQTSAFRHHTSKTNQQAASPAKDQGLTTTNGNGAATSQARTTLSISSLVHASDSVSVITDNKRNNSNKDANKVDLEFAKYPPQWGELTGIHAARSLNKGLPTVGARKKPQSISSYIAAHLIKNQSTVSAAKSKKKSRVEKK
ncbi:Gluconate transport-inducing protein [Clarireedia jacksonii]